MDLQIIQDKIYACGYVSTDKAFNIMPLKKLQMRSGNIRKKVIVCFCWQNIRAVISREP